METFSVFRITICRKILLEWMVVVARILVLLQLRTRTWRKWAAVRWIRSRTRAVRATAVGTPNVPDFRNAAIMAAEKSARPRKLPLVYRRDFMVFLALGNFVLYLQSSPSIVAPVFTAKMCKSLVFFNPENFSLHSLERRPRRAGEAETWNFRSAMWNQRRFQANSVQSGQKVCVFWIDSRYCSTKTWSKNLNNTIF